MIISKVIVRLIVICFEKLGFSSYWFVCVATVFPSTQLSLTRFNYRWTSRVCDICFDYSVSLYSKQGITHFNPESAFISVRLFCLLYFVPVFEWIP